jgi:cobalamin biosynthesis protein CobT
MSFAPLHGVFTVPRRGRAFCIDVDIADELWDAYRLAAQDIKNRAMEQHRERHDNVSDSTSEEQSSSDSDSDAEAASDHSDSEYSPSEMSDDDSDDLDIPSSPCSSIVMDMSPFPDTFSRGHLKSLDFHFIQWNE